jgi:hypothetical protein
MRAESHWRVQQAGGGSQGVNDLPIVRGIGRGHCSIDAYVEAHILMSKIPGACAETLGEPLHAFPTPRAALAWFTRASPGRAR